MPLTPVPRHTGEHPLSQHSSSSGAMARSSTSLGLQGRVRGYQGYQNIC